MRFHVCAAVLMLAVALVGSPPACAQNNRYTERSFVPAPSVRAMGDAGVALSGPDRPFFYNPAQLPHVSSYFTVLGVQAAASRNLRDQIAFFNRRVRPAVEDNFERDTEELEDLYRDAYRLGRDPVRGTGAIVLPSFVYSVNGVGLGGGLFAKTALNYRMSDAGLGVPQVYLLSRTDLMAVLSAGLDLGKIGLSGLSVGGTAAQKRRFLTFENKPLDAFTPDEAALLLRGSAFQVDVGALYTPPWWPLPGRLSVGGAVYDLLDNRYNYTFEDAPGIPFLEGFAADEATVDDETAAREEARARRRFRLRPTYRIGAAYRIPSLLAVEDVAVAVDYQGYGHDQQHLLARLHAGVRAAVMDGLVLRSGLSAGYPTGGLGLRLGAFQIDYAVHAFEEGRVPGQRGTYVHTARLMVRIQ